MRRDVPEPLAPVLRHWIALATQYDPDAAQRVALRLGLPPIPGGRGKFSFLDALQDVTTDPDLLDVVDALLAVHRAPGCKVGRGQALGLSADVSARVHIAENYTELVTDLTTALDDSGSAFTVSPDLRRLVERVDPSVVATVEHTIATSEPTVGALLRDAWNQTYGLHPDPTSAYRQAVRAVEQIACPLVLPADGAATLGKVVSHLRQAGHKWRSVLLDRDGSGTVEPLVEMLGRLWTGQVSRHSGGQNSRDQTQVEAEAAMHLATTLVQLLTSKALTRPDTT